LTAGREAGGLDGVGDVEDVVALGDGEGAGVDVAADDAGVDLGGWRGMVEAVLTGEELAALCDSEEVEGIAAADCAGLLELRGDGLCAGAGRDVDVGGGVVVGAGGRPDGGVDGVGREGGNDESDQEQGCEELQAGLSSMGRTRRPWWIGRSGCILRWDDAGRARLCAKCSVEVWCG
jgi:hypothetical protein